MDNLGGGISALYSAATAVTMMVSGMLAGDTRAPVIITFNGFACVGVPVAGLAGCYWGDRVMGRVRRFCRR
ncbi:hypothetical protein [Marinobacter fonticola]|uniref:hypothetical protein n=1 Tax=Marinobacter fonticola TaxID=2603215 RepID=UPI0011E62BBD|nr:hypothetical protein [Marinobacter fonticola]